MDHYKVLGLSTTATKDQIKEAFRKMALQFHPDKHTHSPKSVQANANRQFKQISEAYEVLMDDRKRADYNFSRSNSGFNSYGHRSNSGYSSSSSNYYHNSHGYSNSYNYYNNAYGYSNNGRNSYGRSSYSGRASNVSGFEVLFRYMSTRSFLINLAFAGSLLGGTYFISSTGDALWKNVNHGKSFDEVMDSMKKTKAVKDEKT